MRLAVKVSDDMAAKISSYSKSFGMSKSAFIAYCVGTHIRTLEQQDGLVKTIKDSVSEKINDALDEQKGDVKPNNDFYE